jgi:hypothetical protein
MKLGYIIIVLGAILSCTSPRGFTQKYNAQYTGLDTLINLKGYYSTEYPYGETSPQSFVFFKSGLVIRGAHDFKDPYMPIGNRHSSFAWGTYTIDRDIVMIQTISDGGFMEGQYIASYKFKIKSKNTIVLLPKYTKNDDNIENNKDYIYNFHNLDQDVDSTNWLLKKKWFWTKDAWKKQKNK